MINNKTELLTINLTRIRNGLKLSINITKSISLVISIFDLTKITDTNQNFNNYNDNIYLANGFNFYFKLNKVFDFKLPMPYNQCYKDPFEFPFNKTIINYINQTGESYYQQKCVRLCFYFLYIQENTCNCTLAKFENV